MEPIGLVQKSEEDDTGIGEEFVQKLILHVCFELREMNGEYQASSLRTPASHSNASEYPFSSMTETRNTSTGRSVFTPSCGPPSFKSANPSSLIRESRSSAS
eukprot:TRINITY_DN2015_c0_g1_i1.p1 TRINITY_DN2015_c0_g1~~TRINITY_DN2015_c0_g1_i1.p1  ORF type:complete len:102 (+),score=11.69 TRINITY_DN2015_c0_g1_i1:89-394(+)